MSLIFFSGHRDKTPERRNAALRIVRSWVESRPYICKQFKAALLYLLPEIKGKEPDEFEHHSDHESE